MPINPKIFKAYDIRGVYPSQINEEAIYDIAQAYVKFFKPKNLVLGRDVRIHGKSLFESAKGAILDLGVDVIDVGIISTDMLYFTVPFYNYDGGITISASHNPPQFNGLKMVRKGSLGISRDSGLAEIQKMALSNQKTVLSKKGKVVKKNILDDYLIHVRKFANLEKIKPLKIVGNANFGAIGKFVEQLTFDLPLKWIKLNWQPDGRFPKGRPDPLRPETRGETIKAILENSADFAVAWDADADRCFFFDEKGQFIEGYFITALLAKYFLKKHPGQKIISDPRLIWAVSDTVLKNKGKLILCKPGHMFIKEKMRQEDVIFAGEMSGHYYFRDNFYADNGLIPFVLMLEILSSSGKKMSELFKPYTDSYFVSGEINFEIEDKEKVLKKVKDFYQNGEISHLGGLSVSFDRNWRFNLRQSDNEPQLLRLNLEAKSKELLEEKKAELLKIIRG